MDCDNKQKETKKQKWERISIIAGICILVTLPVLYCAFCF